MADEEHLAILKKGVEAWNRWREENPNIKPNLRGADLRAADLGGVDFRESSLDRANLSEANLRGGKLDSASLKEVQLRNAKLDSAYCLGVDLSRGILNGADLFEANLSQSDLRATDFREGKLARVNLNGANLEAANLVQSDLRTARIREANLCGADLPGANLHRADFTGSVLRGTDLRWADLGGSNLKGTDMSGSMMGGTWLGHVDLATVRGLETVLHEAPSMIGIDTIYLSHGKIPEIFLRGAGVPKPFIANMKALVEAMEPIQFYSCFISYSSKDQEFAERLYADLQSQGVRCWFASEDMKIGDRIRPEIDEAIRVHDKLLLVLTESSVKSAWVEKEVETAFEKERKQGRTVLFPIRLDDAVMEAEEAWAADIRRTRHIGDFRGWKKHDKYKKVFETLMRDLSTSPPSSNAL